MPQEDPTFYNTFFKNYNVPELITGPVTVTPQELARAAYDNENMLHARLDPEVKERIKKTETNKPKTETDELTYSQQ